ncbi:metallophosphoesterase family protein [Streptomyces sp. NPDC050504]|uniref:metallophosphoesterase family protein n=1 Tax=Streptomyces sp. NPDC050504 TaxID=3365618 RepID=UPI00379250EA
MNDYRAGRSYQPDLDVRFADGTAPAWAVPLTTASLPNGPAWLVVMGRRAGKTWLAHAVQRARGSGATLRVDLRGGDREVRRKRLQCLVGGKGKPGLTEGQLLLVDEPALARPGAAGADPALLAEGLWAVRETGAVPVVFATPAEHRLLVPCLGADAPKDVVRPPALDRAECARFAARAPEWADAVVRGLRAHEEGWTLVPFLLELALQVAEGQPRLRDDPAALARAAVEEAVSRHAYVEQWFRDGLAPEHRAALRSARWRTAGLGECVGRERPDTAIEQDPVLARHLPEVLRVHQISDLHHGGSLRSTVDAKDTSRAGRLLASLAGDGTPMDSYLAHLRRLADTGRAPHLVVVTGDVVNLPEDEYGAQAADWLAEVRALLADHRDLREEDPRVVLVGGNHDVSWDLCLAPGPEARHAWFARVFDAYPHPDLHLADHAARRLYVRYPLAQLRIALLGSAESGGEPVHDGDRARLEEHMARFVAVADDRDGEEAVRLIKGFERYDPAVVARGVLDRLAPEPGYVSIAALHHPLSPVPAVEVAPYSGLLNAGQTKRALSAAETALVLHGHTHLGFAAAERLLLGGREADWTMRIAGAPTLGSKESDEQNGYNEVFVAREGREHVLALRVVRFDGGQWEAGPPIAFRPGEARERPPAELCTDAGQPLFG